MNIDYQAKAPSFQDKVSHSSNGLEHSLLNMSVSPLEKNCGIDIRHQQEHATRVGGN
jgi:hypothetical protein